ncbi:hypothetical protein Tco_0471726 [Tanacetum coccineum]
MKMMSSSFIEFARAERYKRLYYMSHALDVVNDEFVIGFVSAIQAVVSAIQAIILIILPAILTGVVNLIYSYLEDV